MSRLKTQQSLSEVFNVDNDNELTINEDKNSTALINSDSEYDNSQIVPLDDELAEQENEQVKKDVTDDYNVARDNLHRLLNSSNNLLDLAIQVAEGTQEPKSIDSVTKLINTISNINTQLIDLTAKKQDVYIKGRPKTNNKFDGQSIDGNVPMTNVTNNTMFVGSISDLLKQINNSNVIEGTITNGS